MADRFEGRFLTRAIDLLSLYVVPDWLGGVIHAALFVLVGWSCGGDAVVETKVPRMAGVGPPFCCSNLVHLFPVLLSRRYLLCYAHQTALWAVDVAPMDEGLRLVRQAVTCQAPRCADAASNASVGASRQQTRQQVRHALLSAGQEATFSPEKL